MPAQLVRSGALTETQVDEALTLLVQHGGNVKRTCDVLARQGLEVSHQTLSDWKRNTYFDRYHEIAAAYARGSKDRAITQGFREMLQESQELHAELRQRLRDNVDQIEPKDLAKSMQPLAIGMGIATEKVLLLEGRPTEIRETRNPDWYEEKLRELAEDLRNTVDGSCEEETAKSGVESASVSERSGATAISPESGAQTREPSPPAPSTAP